MSLNYEMNKVLYIHTMEYYSETKRNELAIHTTAWRISNISCYLKAARLKRLFCMISFKWHPRKGWVCGEGSTTKGQHKGILQVMNIS